MAREIKLPTLGENVEEAEVLEILVSEGDAVEQDQPLFELETDKATVEVPSPVAGTVKTIRVGKGDTVSVGQVVLELESEQQAEKTAESEEETGEEEADEETAEPAEETDEAESDEEEAAQAAGEEERKTRAEETEEHEEPEEAEPDRVPRDEAPRRARSGPEGTVPAAPSVRRLARELGVDVGDVRGSGPGGRISMEDVKDHVRSLLGQAGGAAARGRARPGGLLALPDFSEFGEVERAPMSGVRRRTAEAMTRSWVAIPHVTQFDRADVTGLERARRRFAPRVEEAGGKLTLTAIAIKVLAAALRVFPRFNASLDVKRDEIILKHYVNVGLAVDTEHGLLAPVVRDADRKSLTEIAIEVSELSERARRRKIRPEELRGANLTVTNLGGLGTTYFSPLVNWPEVAVLGIGRASLEAVWRDADEPGETQAGFEPRRILPLAVSYDHRLIDGADAARFLRWIAEALEQPLLLALES